VAARLGGHLDAHADARLDAQRLGPVEDKRQFARHFKHQKAQKTHFAGVQGQIDVILILVAVADQTGLGFFRKDSAAISSALLPTS
jgi:hypothetical protein